MIIKANAVLKVRVPETEAFEGKSPEQIVEAIRTLVNKQIAPSIEADTGLIVSMQIKTKDLRVAE